MMLLFPPIRFKAHFEFDLTIFLKLKFYYLTNTYPHTITLLEFNWCLALLLNQTSLKYSLLIIN